MPQPPVPKPALDSADFLAKLNELLAQKAMFEPGMAFVAVPPGTADDAVAAFDWQGGQHHRTMFLKVAHDVQSAFALAEGPAPLASPATGDLGYVEGEHLRELDNLLFRYSIRYTAGPSGVWHARVACGGAPAVPLSGQLSGNVHGGGALAAALCAMVEALIEAGDIGANSAR